MKIQFIKRLSFATALALMLGIVSCGSDPEEMIDPPFAAFNFTIGTENTLMVTFENTSVDGSTYSWDFGDGTGTSADENPSYTYTAGGTYEVTLTATNAGGTDETTQSITVSGFGDNLVTNGDMSETSGWNELAIWTNEDNAVEHRIVDEVFRFQNGVDGDGNRYQWSNYAVYQEVQLEAGKTYQFNADVSSTSGTLATWFEVFLTASVPLADESNIGGDQVQLAIKSFGDGENCTATEFSGTILEIASQCSGINAFDQLIGANGQFAVSATDLSESGSIFLVFKAGSGFAPDGEVAGFRDGINLDNVEIKEVL